MGCPPSSGPCAMRQTAHLRSSDLPPSSRGGHLCWLVFTVLDSVPAQQASDIGRATSPSAESTPAVPSYRLRAERFPPWPHRVFRRFFSRGCHGNRSHPARRSQPALSTTALQRDANPLTATPQRSFGSPSAPTRSPLSSYGNVTGRITSIAIDPSRPHRQHRLPRHNRRRRLEVHQCRRPSRLRHLSSPHRRPPRL